MAILIADTKLETEVDAWYQFYVDTMDDIADLPTSTSTGGSYRVKKFARPASIAYCIEMASVYALDSNDQWRLLYALRDDVADALLESVEEIKKLVANTSQSEQNAADSAAAAAKSASAASKSEQAANSSATAAAANERASRDSATESIRAEGAALEYQKQAQAFANQAAGYAGAATYAFGPDADGRFAFFIRSDQLPE